MEVLQSKISFVITLQKSKRYWYGFLAQDSERIMELLKKIYKEQYIECPQAQRHKSFLIDPRELIKHLPDLKIWRVKHEPGYYVITGPGVFHEGFNSGYNMAEAVNFGIQRWLKYFKNARCCFCLENGCKENMAALKISDDDDANDDDDDESDCDDSNHKSYLLKKQNTRLDPLVFGNTRTTFFIIISPILKFESLQKNLEKEGKKWLSITQQPGRYNYATYSMGIFSCTNLKKRVISSNFIHSKCPRTLENCIVIPFLENNNNNSDLLIQKTASSVNFEKVLKIKYSIFRDICKANGWLQCRRIYDSLFWRKENKTAMNLPPPPLVGSPLAIPINNNTEEQIYSIAFCDNHPSKIYCCLANADGVCVLRSNLNKASEDRQSFWKDLIIPIIGHQYKLITPTQFYLQEIFDLTVEDMVTVNRNLIEILPFSNSVFQNSIELEVFNTLSKRFPLLNLDEIKVEDIARLQILFFKQDLTPFDLNYLSKISLPNLQQSNSFALNICFKEQHWKIMIVDKFGQSHGCIERYVNYNKTNVNNEISILTKNLLLNDNDKLICSGELSNIINKKEKIFFVKAPSYETRDFDSKKMIKDAQTVLACYDDTKKRINSNKDPKPIKKLKR